MLIKKPPRFARYTCCRSKETVMLGWIVRIIMIVSGVVAGLFVAKDAPLFGVVQTMVMLLLLALIVAVVAFWPERWSFRRSRIR